MTRKLLTSKNSECPRCKFNDQVNRLDKNKEHWLTKRVLDWFRDNTTYTEDQLTLANKYCNRCNIVFVMEGKQ